VDEMNEVLLLLLGTSILAFLLTASVGRPGRILGAGLTTALAIPFVLAVWDPDGSCDSGVEDCGYFLTDVTAGEWFFFGVIGSSVLLLAWVVGVGAGALARRPTHSR
jgi:predicted small integral membrane protein